MRNHLFRHFGFVLLFLLFSTASSALTLGPYSGQVVDSRTGEPIAGASVLIYWIKIIPNNFEGGTEVPIEVKLTYTDDKGGYHVPKISTNLGLSAILDLTYVIIYQPGYEAYRVYVRHFDPSGESSPPKDFKEKENMVKLDRVPPDFDHKSHYKKITDLFVYIDEYEEIYTGFLPTEKPRMTGPILELREFLRRVEWEDRRDRDEEGR
ncbi:MAG TPA: hypothetical protein VJ373_07165 [Desulfatiglandales bacterium]|nr:hypothetical protein [Desulfatiglandales bacterium]